MRRYAFCPVCGGGLPPTQEDIVHHHLCPRCGFVFWQNSKPAVGAIVIRMMEGKPHLLLTRRGIDPHKGLWDVPGGYLENGEHPHDGLRRELREELRAEARVGDLFAAEVDEYPREDVAEEARFVLGLYYRCEIISTEALVPGDDVTEARWFPLEVLPADIAFAANRRVLARLASLAPD